MASRLSHITRFFRCYQIRTYRVVQGSPVAAKKIVIKYGRLVKLVFEYGITIRQCVARIHQDQRIHLLTMPEII